MLKEFREAGSEGESGMLTGQSSRVGAGRRVRGSFGGIGRFGGAAVCESRRTDTALHFFFGATQCRVRGGVKTHAHFYHICTGIRLSCIMYMTPFLSQDAWPIARLCRYLAQANAVYSHCAVRQQNPLPSQIRLLWQRSRSGSSSEASQPERCQDQQRFSRLMTSTRAYARRRTFASKKEKRI